LVLEWEQIWFPVPGRLGMAPVSGIPDMQGMVLVPDMVDKPDTLDRVLVPDMVAVPDMVDKPDTLDRVLVPGTLGRAPG
jgi:hypothetical protein